MNDKNRVHYIFQFKYIVCIILFGTSINVNAQERIFANYFDIPTSSPANSEVIGAIHLERNKDAFTSPIPSDYRFEIVDQSDDIFRIETRFEDNGRIKGVFILNKKSDSRERDVNLEIALKSNDKVLNRFDVTIKIVDKSLWSTLFDRYIGITTSNSRLWGRKKPKDNKVLALIEEIEEGDGRLSGYKCYDLTPKDFASYITEKTPAKYKGPLESEWISISSKIGGLGYAYATSDMFSSSNPENRQRLKHAIYSSLLEYVKCVPIEGRDVLIDGKAIGENTGDGFILLSEHRLLSHQVATHQWNLSDPIITPCIQIMPELLADAKSGDPIAQELHQALIRYFQLPFSVVESRRAIDDPQQRWGEIQDLNYSSGAWSDANLGHRSRTMLALPIIWADYNRPITYVQYWYSDFYKNTPTEDFSFSPSWSPNGVIADIGYWLTKYNIPAHKYAQSGFQPDGTVSHHIGHGTDAAMVAYGFEWLTDGLYGTNMFKDTDFEIDPIYSQFVLDRLLNVYPKLFYRGRMDFLVSGRSYLSDQSKFVKSVYLRDVAYLIESKSKDVKLKNEDQLLNIASQIKKGTYEASCTEAFWVAEFLVHRKSVDDKSFYASLKLKSQRTVGIEDFSDIRKSWHGGSGILQFKVRGDEYDDKTLKNMDWHMLPGLTEEWRTDPLPAEGGSQASLPGNNSVAGVLSDGDNGMGIYHHSPQETYSSTSALKSYYFVGDRVLALGSDISRIREGQQQEIATCIDQSYFTSALTYSTAGDEKSIDHNQSVDITVKIDKPSWVHIGDKGYVIYPQVQSELHIKTGDKINITDRAISSDTPNFILALMHGVNPQEGERNSYCYFMIPNVTKGDMPEIVEQLERDVEFNTAQDSIHATYFAKDSIYQFAFFKKGEAQINNHKVASDDAAMIMVKETKYGWKLSVGNPAPDHNNKTELTFTTTLPLTEGGYSYSVGGVYPQKGESVTITNEGTHRKVVVELPDSRDEVAYNYQTELYNGTPIVIEIPFK